MSEKLNKDDPIIKIVDDARKENVSLILDNYDKEESKIFTEIISREMGLAFKTLKKEGMSKDDAISLIAMTKYPEEYAKFSLDLDPSNVKSINKVLRRIETVENGHLYPEHYKAFNESGKAIIEW